ncbi:MAG: sugar ABC transporter permease [Propionibacteriaceae bacterium]|jgi:multiple sugar transport system permease protein/raffinose/stachyose/melibiose transport system permease protein|nr:sugar ABC transporter permease [Propionibacteriaceae bacterium]
MSGTGSITAPVATLQTSLVGGGRKGSHPRATGGAGRRKSRWQKRFEITLLAGPGAIIFVIFVIIPVFVALYYSFFAWKGFGPATDFIGFGNYKWTLTNPEFWWAVGHNFAIAALSLLFQGPLAILVALLLNRKMRGRSLIRVLIFVPYVISEAIVGIGWSLMLQDTGAINKLISNLHLGDGISWISDPKIAMWTLMFVISWKYVGFAVILMLAGLQGIPEELSEAAAVDGASYWQIQRHIMLPLLTPTIKIWAFLSVIGSMQLFDLVYVIWGQYIANIAGTSTMAYFMAQNGRLSGQLGRGSAIAIVVFVISLIVALAFQKWVLNRNTEGALTNRPTKEA